MTGDAMGDLDQPPSSSRPTALRHPSRAGVADAIGHCLLVFAFLPTLAAIPSWLYFEGNNALNWTDPVVLIFLPVRGMLRALAAFSQGAVPGSLAGAIFGALVSLWIAWLGNPVSRGSRLALGSVGGAISAGFVSLLLLMFFAAGDPSHATAAGFEIASGVLCGAMATPTAIGLLEPALPRS